MLYSVPTKKAAGVILFGDAYDFGSLLATISRLYDGDPFIGSPEGFLHDFAHEVRQASSGIVTSMPAGNPTHDESHYHWVLRLWPRFLVEIGMLRRAAGLHPTTKRDQSNLYALEACAEASLLAIDPIIGHEAIGWLDSFSRMQGDFLPEFITELEAEYVGADHDRRARFSRLPHLLQTLGTPSGEYRAFHKRMATLAKRRGCDPEDLTREDFPPFIW